MHSIQKRIKLHQYVPHRLNRDDLSKLLDHCDLPLEVLAYQQAHAANLQRFQFNLGEYPADLLSFLDKFTIVLKSLIELCLNQMNSLRIEVVITADYVAKKGGRIGVPFTMHIRGSQNKFFQGENIEDLIDRINQELIVKNVGQHFSFQFKC